MAYTLNTGHALYPFLTEIIGVQAGALVSLKTARTFTAIGTGTSFGSGTFGEHFRTVAGGFTVNGATFSPTLVLNTNAGQAHENSTQVLVLNRAIATGGGGQRPFLSSTSSDTPTLALTQTGDQPRALAAYNDSTGLGVVGTSSLATAKMLTLTRTGQTAHQLFVNATQEGGAGGKLANGGSAATYGTIGGVAGQGSVSADFVWAMWFSKVLTPTEISDLYASLGAGNTLSLVTVASTPVSFSGTVPTLGGTTSVAFSQSLSSYFAGTATPFTYSLFAGTLPAGLTLNTSTGVISGTPTVAGTQAGIVIRATDTGAATANTNSFSIAIAATNTAPLFNGPNIGAQSGTVSTALTALDVSSRYSDAEGALTFSAVGTWPAGVAVSSAGVISGTPTAAGSYTTLTVRATDVGGLTVSSDSFTFTVAAAPPPSTVTVLDALRNNTGTLWSNQSGIRVSVVRASDFVQVYAATGLATNASGILQAVSGAGIVTATSYHVAIKLADGSVGITQAITAS